MALFINSNIVSLTTQHKLSTKQNAVETSFQRLSSGLRINSAKDDAAGLGIADRMTSIVRGQTVAVRNANDAISYSQVAEGALSSITGLLQRMRELAVQSANPIYTEADHASLNAEFVQLQVEITRITTSTRFNDNAVFDGTAKTFQVGSGTQSDNQITLQGSNLTLDTSNTGKAAFINNGVTQTSVNSARSKYISEGGTFNVTDGSPAGGGDVGALLATESAFQNNINPADQSTFDNAKTVFIGANGSFSAIDGNAVMAKSGSTTVVVMIGGVPVTQTIPISTPSDINAFNTFKAAEFEYFASAKGIQILDQPSALSAIQVIDGALQEIQNEAALHGASENRMTMAISNLQTSIENQSAARSRIMDADFASEMATLTQNQILQKAAVAVLAQANLQSNIVLSLLK